MMHYGYAPGDVYKYLFRSEIVENSYNKALSNPDRAWQLTAEFTNKYLRIGEAEMMVGYMGIPISHRIVALDLVRDFRQKEDKFNVVWKSPDIETKMLAHYAEMSNEAKAKAFSQFSSSAKSSVMAANIFEPHVHKAIFLCCELLPLQPMDFSLAIRQGQKAIMYWTSPGPKDDFPEFPKVEDENGILSLSPYFDQPRAQLLLYSP
ncbi:hypothetical protein BDP27DRAFT_418755 [Rhodocollybia butyracea]|uniref:Uncharacterized protein n=1 Tax=Rhodocollybia butyracea TaxID=206335 RepID=A0A9P5TZP8_9AGAR|nr:hypothetical protein BDP27DRAFT_418755 [Rhodocollybia butyracea]